MVRNEHTEALETVSLLVSSTLSEPLANGEFEKLVEIQAQSWIKQEVLVDQLTSRTINQEQFQLLANDEHTKLLEEFRKVVGELNFLSMFGEVGYDPDKVAPDFPDADVTD